jgi:hypothetical protein
MKSKGRSTSGLLPARGSEPGVRRGKAVNDFTRHQHLLFSAGRSIDGPTDFQVYIAWQFTFGPEFFHSIARSFRSGASAERRISLAN